MTVIPGIWTGESKMSRSSKKSPDIKVHVANMGPIWGRQDPDWPHIGPMNVY